MENGTAVEREREETIGDMMSSLKKLVDEADPNGKAAGEPGAKLDDGKIRPRMVLGNFPRALEEVVVVGTAGANKYCDGGWMEVPDGASRYAEAAERHALQVNKGVEFDDSMDQYCPKGYRVRHKAQRIWNLLAELELELRGKE